MANREVYSWIAADNAAIAALQTYVGAATLKLNGTLGRFENNHFGPVVLNKIARTVTLTSVVDLSGVNVTISGFQDGAPVSQTIAGPDSNTVESTALFNIITSVTTNGAVTSMSVGTGQSGQTNWYLFDAQASVANLALQGVVTGTVSYTWQVTLDVPNNAGTNPPATVFAPAAFNPITLMTSAATTLLGSYTSPFKYCNFLINSSSGAATATFTILQQGLHS